MAAQKNYRVNYGQGQVSNTMTLADCKRHISEMDQYGQFAFIERREGGEWATAVKSAATIAKRAKNPSSGSTGGEKRALLAEVEADIKIAKKLRSLPAESVAALKNTAAQLRKELKMRKRKNPAQITKPAHNYRGYSVIRIQPGSTGRVQYMVQPYNTWGNEREAMSFGVKSVAEFAAGKCGHVCTVIPLGVGHAAAFAEFVKAAVPGTRLRKNPAPRPYLAKYANGKRLAFNARNDGAAVRYATGLGKQRVGGAACKSCVQVSAPVKKKIPSMTAQAVRR